MTAQARWPALKRLVKGSLDLRAALDTDEARQLKQTMAQLKPEQVKSFKEDLALAGMYTHGTHVAGIAVAGNPFASVYPVAMHWSHLHHSAEAERSGRARVRRELRAHRRRVSRRPACGWST